MHDRLHLNGAFKRGSTFDSFLDSSKKNQGWRFNQGNMVSTSLEKGSIIGSMERETRTQERLRRLSLSIKSRVQSITGGNEFTQNKIQIEQVLLYINTGAKYNSSIYDKKEEYAQMVYEIFSVGGHCYDIMMSSFKNIVSNPKVNGVIMSRMDRLLNFLSFIQDLYKNYCDPTIIGITTKHGLQNVKTKNKSQDYRSRNLSYIHGIDTEILNEGEKIIQPNKKLLESISKKMVQNINLKKSLLEKYKIEIENKNSLSLKNSKNTYDFIKQRSLRDIKKSCTHGDQILSQELTRTKSYEGSLRKVFESLQSSRKKSGEDRARSLSKSSISKDFVSNNGENRSKSENSFKSEDQRIQGLQRLIKKLKEVKLSSNNSGAKAVESPKNSSVSLSFATKEPRRISKTYSSSIFDSLKDENLIQTQVEFLNVLNKNIKVGKCLSEKGNDKNNSKESTHKENRRWELDTPYIRHRDIKFDNNLRQENKKENNSKSVSADYCENTMVEQQYIPGIPPVKYEYFEIKDTVCEIEHINSESIPEMISQIDQESVENYIKLEKSPELPEFDDNTNKFDNFLAAESVSLRSGQNIDLEDVIPEDNLSKTNIQFKTTNQTFVNSAKGAYIDENREKLVGNKLYSTPSIDYSKHSSTDLEEPEKTPERRCEPEDSPLKPIKFLKSGEATVEEISKITDRLEDMTIVNENLIKRIEDLPIENIDISNENSISILNPYINSEEKNPINEKNLSMDRLPSIEYFTLGDEELKSKIEEYSYWFENINSGNYYELSLDGLNLEEFYYKNIESIPRCYDELIDMSESSVYNLCKIICDTLPKVIIEQIEKDTGSKVEESEANIGIEVLAHHELCEEKLLSFVHNQVMEDPNYLKFKSSIRKEIYPPDDNFILLIIDLMRELVQEWKDDISNYREVPITNELISKQVVGILCDSYEPYLSEVNSEEWLLKKVFHAPHYPNILEPEKELLNIEHLFKYHSCEDSITNEYINMDRQKWLQTSNYYLPLLNEIIEQILHEIVDSTILELNSHN